MLAQQQLEEQLLVLLAQYLISMLLTQVKDIQPHQQLQLVLLQLLELAHSGVMRLLLVAGLVQLQESRDGLRAQIPFKLASRLEHSIQVN